MVLSDSFTLFPNPTNNTLNIKLGTKEASLIQLYTITGSKVLETKVNNQNINIDVSKLAFSNLTIEGKNLIISFVNLLI
jgi:hypothetical protein